MDIYNVSLYKDARLKQWLGYLCKPPVGTCFLGDMRFVGLFRGKPFISSEDYARLYASNQPLAVSLRDAGCVVFPGSYLVYNAAGQFISLFGEQVFDQFRTQTGITLTERYIVEQSNISYKRQGEGAGYYLASDEHGTPADKDQLLQTGVFDWIGVQSLSREQFKALFVPLGECITLADGTVVNDPRIGGHGKGDFIVVRMGWSDWDWQNMRCIPGSVFQRLYNNIGWVDCLINEGYELQKPPSFYQTVKGLQDKSDEVIREVYKIREGVLKGRYELVCGPIVSVSNPDGRQYEIKVDTNVLYVDCEGKNAVSVIGRKIQRKNTDELRSFLSLLLGVQRKGWLSRMRAAYCDIATRNAISRFTGAGYEGINTAMRSGSFMGIGIEMYLDIYNIYSYLGRCSSGGVTLFRGMRLSSEPKAGATVDLDCFTSWSLGYFVAKDFIKNERYHVFVLKDVSRIHAAYINAISEHRDREFEVLVNAGYSLKVESKLADRLWLCSLVENEGFYLREKSTPSGDFISMLGYSIDSDPILRGSVYVAEDYDGIFIGNSFSDDRLQVQVSESGWVCGELSGSFDDLDGSVAKVIGYLRGIVNEFRKKVGSDKLYYHCSSFMYNITSKFASEGFQIIRQKFINRDDISEKKNMRGALQISGDSDDHITLQFLIKDDLSVSVSARDKENQIKQTFSAINNDVYQNVYDEVVHKCKLNQFGRLEKALKLVSGYCREPLTVVDKGKYSLGSKYRIIAVMDGEMVQLYIRGGIKSSHSYYFWDNLRDIAVGVSNALCGDEKK